MARFRKRSRSRSRGFMKKSRRSSKKSSGGGNTMECAITGLVYGAARPYVAQLLSPVIEKIPLGQYADEAAMGGTALLVGMLMPSTKKYTNKVITVETSRIGEILTGGVSKSATGGSMVLLG